MNWSVLLVLAACGGSELDSRDQFVINVLAEDNYLYAMRDPVPVAMKLVTMQRDPFDWLRGSASVYWRDLMSVGVARPTTAFGDPASARVLLVADPHPENIGTFRAADGTMIADWNDLDTAGYGPYEGDVRRLAAGMIIAGGDPSIGDAISRSVAAGYVAQIIALGNGVAPQPVGMGDAPYLDKAITKAATAGDAGNDLIEYAPVVDGARTLVFGDLDPIADDGAIENRVLPLGPDEMALVTRAMQGPLARHPALGTIKTAGRRYGSGVSSYPALRYYVLVEGPTASVDDDRIVELKEEHEGLALSGVPQLEAAEWSSPAVRTVDAQRRLQARPDEDAFLDDADVLPLPLKMRELTSYQRGVNADDLATIVADPSKHDQIFALAQVFGGLLARAHGMALTDDGVPGWTVIAPVIGDGSGFADELSSFATADAAQVQADWESLKDRDLAPLVLPKVRE